MEQREIKFRAWDKENSKFYRMNTQYDIYIFFENLGNKHIQNKINLHRIVLQQYTGLKDKNGKEIYEGDIIEWDAFTGCKIKKRRRTEVGYYIREWASEFTFPTIMHKKSLEVIGNIYENKELLK